MRTYTLKSGKYRVEYDTLQYVLKAGQVVKGEQRWKTVGYYGSERDLLKGLAHHGVTSSKDRLIDALERVGEIVLEGVATLDDMRKAGDCADS